MACKYVRFAFLTIACLLASRGVSQENASGYSRYGTPSASQPYGQGSYGYAPSPRHEPSSAYPQTMTQSPPYQGATWQGEPIVEFPSTSSSAPMRTPITGGQATNYPMPVAANPNVPYPPQQPSGQPATGYRQTPNSVYDSSYRTVATTQFPAPATQGGPQFASMGNGASGMYAPGMGQTSEAPLPVPAEPYYGNSFASSVTTGCDQYGCDASSSRFFMTYDFLYWTISPPKTTKIGSTQLEGDYTRGGVTTHFENSLDTSFMDVEFQSGHRVEFGCRDCYSGWLVGYSYGSQSQGLTSSSVNFLPADPGFPNFAQSYLAGYSDGNGDGIDDDLNLNNFYGRFGEDVGTPDGMGGYNLPTDGTPDVPAPTDTGDLQIYLPVFDEASVQNTLTMSNLEIMYMTRMNRDHTSNIELLYGVRYLDLEDYFSFSGTGGTLDATSVAVTSDNRLLGLQLGARWQKCFGAWYLNAEGRFLAAANMQNNQMQGHVASNILTNSNGQNGPVNLNPQSFNYAYSDNEWAPLGELRLQAILPINDWAAFRLGYTGFVVGGISRASQKVDYVLPRFGLNRSASNETVVFNSFNLGFEINR